jgi:hypothetical protein
LKHQRHWERRCHLLGQVERRLVGPDLSDPDTRGDVASDDWCSLLGPVDNRYTVLKGTGRGQYGGCITINTADSHLIILLGAKLDERAMDVWIDGTTHL